MAGSAWQSWRVALAAAMMLAACVLGLAQARAGSLDRETLASIFPAPLAVGEREADLPVWPIFLGSGGGERQLMAWAFESIDLTPLPGFSGQPINLLVALRPDGSFMDVRVLQQSEPVFLHGLGPAPLDAFVRQYAGHSLVQPIKVGSGHGSAAGSAAVEIDGVAKATASVLVVNDTVLSSALEVARAKLGLGGSRQAPARPRDGPAEALSWAELVARGWVQPLRLTNRDVEAAFADGEGRGLDAEALADPEGQFADLWVAYLDLPTIGRSLLGETAWRKLHELRQPGEQALWVGSAGRWTILPEDAVPGAVPDRLSVRQGGLPVEVRDFVLEPRLLPADAPPFDATMVLRLSPASGFDPASPWQMLLRVTRAKGQIYPALISRDLPLTYSLPEELFERPSTTPRETGWRPIWRARSLDIAILATALTLLAGGLLAQRRLTAHGRTFAALRWTWLCFCLGFIGWWAQGQLSIVNLLGLVRAAAHGGTLTFTLFDPMTFLIGAFTLPTLLIWGRGTFCGWLCPFGALQEMAAWLAQKLRVPQLRVPPTLDLWLRRLKYLVLAVILAAAWLSSDLAESLAEVEPFKTAITLAFIRSLPFVLYAVALLLAGMTVFKAYCRYLCPLGAALAVLGLARRWRWLPRRPACGSPCRLCEVRCRYGAIRRDGAVRYDECFQCLECVVIHDDPKSCVPLVLAQRRARALGASP
ncbi:MAG: 4Fe-4S binding protein [Geminicoccaceae bacterium]